MIFVAILVVMKTKQKQFSLLSIPSELDITKAKFPFSLNPPLFDNTFLSVLLYYHPAPNAPKVTKLNTVNNLYISNECRNIDFKLKNESFATPLKGRFH